MRKIKRIIKTIPIFWSRIDLMDPSVAVPLFVVFVFTGMPLLFLGIIYIDFLLAILSTKYLHLSDLRYVWGSDHDELINFGLYNLGGLILGSLFAFGIIALKRNIYFTWSQAWYETSSKKIARDLMK